MDNSKTLKLSDFKKARDILDAQSVPALTQAQVELMIQAAVQAALAAKPEPAPVLATPSVAELRKLLQIEEARIANEESQKIVITPNPPDLSHLPPIGERSSSAIQAPAKMWGNPGWLGISRA